MGEAHSMYRRESGFTAIELITVIVLAFFVGSLFLVQNNSAAANSRDAERKRDINAIYYYLEYVYYPTHKSYPATLVAKDLPGLDPEVLKDPNGYIINNKLGSLAYVPTGCVTTGCSAYRLTAGLEKGAPFSQTNVSH
ncbi:MAG TPA: hypothetical protein VGS28_00410 [Candidatus Saccharimonadales bacterium]|nr:hypothetical protein [Candidatus Saccharimonadales bacterium]